MTKQEKERNMKLARYIACALMLGNGLLFAPVADATPVVIDGGTYNDDVTGNSDNNSQNNNHLTINNGTFNDDVFGGRGDDTNPVSGNVLTINGGTLNAGCAGGSGISKATNSNSVIINGGTIKATIYGGFTWGSADGNSVTIAGNNPLNLSGANIILSPGNGSPGTINNHIDINRSGVSIFSLKGYTTATKPHSGNTLNLNALNTTVSGYAGVSQFDTIAIGCGFTDGATVLSTTNDNGAFSSIGTLDVRKLYNTDTLGTMTLLSSKKDIGVTNLLYGTGTGTSTALGDIVPVKQGTDTTEDDQSAVKFSYYKNAHMVTKATDSGTRMVQYNIGNNVYKVTLGEIAWNATTAARDLSTESTKYTFFSSDIGDKVAKATTIDSTNLSFTGKATSQSMTLLSGASNIKSSTTAKNINIDASITDEKGVKWVGQATAGNVVSNSTDGTVKYNITAGTINSINLGGWSSGSLSFLSGWSGTNIAVDTGSFTASPTAGTILTAPTGSSFGTVTGDKAYSSGETFTDNVKGVTLSGTKAGGVRVNTTDATKLEYVSEERNTTGVALGDVTWGDGRVATSSYNFSGVQSVDASKLKFTFTGTDANTIKASPASTMAILSGATNLASGLPVTGANHSQSISYDDTTNKVTLNGTLTGTVSTSTGQVDYTVTKKTLEKVDLSNWEGTENITIDGSWEKGTSGGIDVDTGSFTTPTTDKEIMTLSGDLEFGEVTGDKKYRDNEKFSGDKDKGVSLSGTKSGGVKVDDTKKKLQYKKEQTNVDSITLEAMGWNDPRTMDSTYNFNNVGDNGIDASNLSFTFTNDDVNNINTGDDTNLITGATGLGDNLKVKGSPKDQSISYNAVNGAAIGGTLTGDVTTDSGTVKYTVTKKSLDSVNLSNWNSTKTSYDVSSGHWTKKTGGITVSGSGFTPPTASVPTTFYIMDRGGAGFFSDAHIDDSIIYKDSGTYNETDKGVTLSGSQSKGVTASDDGQSLLYKIGTANISNVAFGGVTYQKDSIYLDKSGSLYNYGPVTSFDLSGFSLSMNDSDKQSARAGDSMTLLKGNNTLKDIGATSVGASSYTYTATPGLDVTGEVTGAVSSTGGNVIYSVTDNKATNLNFSNVGWSSTFYNRPDTEIAYNSAAVEAENLTFSGISTLSKGDKMILVNNFGDGVKKTSGGIFTLGGQSGKGHSYWENGSLWYVVDRGINDVVEKKDAIDENTQVVSGETKTESVAGGQAEGDGVAKKNEADVSNAKIKIKEDGTGGDVIGGSSEEGIAENNTANVTNSEVDGNIYGGKTDTGTNQGNTANVSDTTVGGSVYGGYAIDGEVTSNTASVSGGEVDGNVYGGKTDGTDQPVDQNTVVLADGAVVNGSVYGGYSANGTASGNTVTIKKANIRDYLYGGKSKTRSANDKVNFEDGSVLGIIGGGCAEALNNNVTVSSGTVQEHAIGGFADNTATGNSITINGGTVNGSVIGGYAGDTADGNSVYLGGGKVEGKTFYSTTLGVTIDGGVYGGYSNSSTKNNSVYLYGDADVSSTNLIGGNQEFTGNLLNIGYMLNGTPTAWTGGDQSVKNISNFENLNFSVAPWDTSKAAVTISDGTASNLSNTTVGATQVAFTGVKTLAKGDTMTLLDQNSVAAANKATQVEEKSKYTLGTAAEGVGVVSKDAEGNIIYTVDSISASEQTHNTVVAGEAGIVALTAGNDFINSATEGLARKENIGKDGISTYAKIGGSSLRQETGSHANVNTWNAILALGHKNVQKKSTFEYGAFIEHGRGNYSTFNDNGQRGDGSLDYTGGGLLGKWTSNKGLYVEGSIRAGSLHDDAKNLLRDNVQAYSYDQRTNYYGFHLGVGKETTVAGGNLVDVYGKYFYNRKNSMDFNVNGDNYNLDAVNSQIFRLGARYTIKGSRWDFYGDLSYEHEFDGKATGTVNGLAIRGADTSGGSVRLEIGTSLVPSEKSPWNVDLNLTAYAGKKQGIKGGVSLKYSF